MTELPILNYVGYLGWLGLMAFYWMIGTGRPALAYWCSIFGAAMFLTVGVANWLGYAAHMPSLVGMEISCIVLNIRALVKLRRA